MEPGPDKFIWRRLRLFENALRNATRRMSLAEFRSSGLAIQDILPSVLQEQAVFQLRHSLWMGSDEAALCKIASDYGVRVAVDLTYAGSNKQGPDRYTLIF